MIEFDYDTLTAVGILVVFAFGVIIGFIAGATYGGIASAQSWNSKELARIRREDMGPW